MDERGHTTVSGTRSGKSTPTKIPDRCLVQASKSLEPEQGNESRRRRRSDVPKTNAEREGHGVTELLRLLTTGGLIGVGRRLGRASRAERPGFVLHFELEVRRLLELAPAPNRRGLVWRSSHAYLKSTAITEGGEEFVKPLERAHVAFARENGGLDLRDRKSQILGHPSRTIGVKLSVPETHRKLDVR